MGYITMPEEKIYPPKVDRSVCHMCGGWETDERQIHDCERCGLPTCENDAEIDYDFVGDPGHYKLVQWDCGRCINPEAYQQ